jgi:FkbM family methyltransferase
MRPMGPMFVSLRRRLPKGLRAGLLRVVGRAPVASERVVSLELPRPAGAALTIRTPSRTYVSGVLARTGLAGYEPDTLACFLAAIEERAGEPVFDVGANIGVFSWLAASLTASPVVAFEPTPELATQMRAICAENALTVRVEEIALGATPGTANLYVSDATDSSNSLRAGFRPSHRSVAVPVETIDGFAERTGLRPGVLKVDTEATEPDVLRGAAAILATVRPWIICEVLAGRTEADLSAILAPLGYAWYRIDGIGPLAERSVIEGDPAYRHLNWLFAPDPPSPAFWERSAAWSRSIAAIGSDAAP